MHMFQLRRADDVDAAIKAASGAQTAQQGADIRFLAGGTTLIDLMKLNVETPQHVIDINHLPLDKIEAAADGGLKIGATVRNADLAHDERVARDYPVLSQALLSRGTARLAPLAAAPARALPGCFDGLDVLAVDGKKLKRAAKRLLATRAYSSGSLLGGKLLVALSVGSGRHWAVFPALGWGIGLAIHGVVVFFLAGGSNLHERMVQAERDRLAAAQNTR